MLFLLSKLLWFLIEPGNAILLVAVIGVLLGRSRRWSGLGYGLSALGAATFLVIALLPIPRWMLAPLENRFPLPQHLPQHVDGIIVLGGALDPEELVKHGTPGLNDDAERMTSFVKLVRRYPAAKAVFTGGNGGLDHPGATEADAAKQLFADLGLDSGRVLFEGRSRNTYENVLFSKDLVHPHAGETWVLVTSADHMPRAVGIFRELDWPVIPYPVAYKSDGGFEPDFAGHLTRVDQAAHEWVGLIAYWLMGRTNTLFPAAEASGVSADRP